MSIPSINKEAAKVTGVGLDVIEEKYPRLFMGLVHHRNTDGDRMTFSDKKWLADIYKDNHRDQVFMKCSQVHMTEHALCGMYTLARQGNRGMYILPSKEHRRTFVSDRINRMKDWSPLYKDALKEGTTDGSDSNVYKTIFGTGWKFVGSNVRNDFFEFPCNVLFFDEYDLLNQENIKYAYDRIANARRPHVWKFGNPTRDGFGIHAEWLESNQCEWHVECHCGKEQILDWYEHFVKEVEGGGFALRHVSGMPICEQCGDPFDRLGPGKWIALNPGAYTHGYHISRLFVNKSGNKRGSQDILKLFKKFGKAQDDPTALQNFHNNYLAVTYENIDFKITDGLLDECRLQDTIEYDPSIFRSVMGVDQGKHFTCTISIVVDGILYDVHYADVNTWEDVKDLETEWNVIFTVVDAQGGGYSETREFCKEKGGRYMCYYRAKDHLKQLINPDEKTATVEVNRTEILDRTVQAMKKQKIKIPKDFKYRMNGNWVKQMKASSRVTDPSGRPVWTKGTDHFFHSAAYRYIAYLLSGLKNSLLTSKSWHTEKTIVKKKSEPTAKLIGDRTPKQDNETKKKIRKWYT